MRALRCRAASPPKGSLHTLHSRPTSPARMVHAFQLVSCCSCCAMSLRVTTKHCKHASMRFQEAFAAGKWPHGARVCS